MQSRLAYAFAIVVALALAFGAGGYFLGTRNPAGLTPDSVVVSLHEPEGSTRLRWHGPIATLAPHGDAVRLLVHASPDLLADLTPAAATELELVPGREVWLSAKATAVSRYAARR